MFQQTSHHFIMGKHDSNHQRRWFIHALGWTTEINPNPISDSEPKAEESRSRSVTVTVSRWHAIWRVCYCTTKPDEVSSVANCRVALLTFDNMTSLLICSSLFRVESIPKSSNSSSIKFVICGNSLWIQLWKRPFICSKNIQDNFIND